MIPDEDAEKLTEREDEMRTKIIESHAAQLSEHFDSVQIIVTAIDPEEGTGIYRAGRGNYYARIGAVEEWLRREKKK